LGTTPLRRAGLAFEKSIAKALPQVVRGPWFGFEDARGRGVCQPDFLLLTARGLLVCEAKLTYTSAAWTQLDRLYIPVLRWWLDYIVERPDLPLLGTQICNKITFGVESVAVLDDVTADCRCVHWLGHTTLTTQALPLPEEWLDRALLTLYTTPNTIRPAKIKGKAR
jgi:hypothetical protein